MNFRNVLIIVAVFAMVLAAFNGIVTGEAKAQEGSQSGTQRIVLAETFTSVQCYYCQFSDPALDQLQSEYGYTKMITLEYHGIYGTDPWSFTAGESRGTSYYGVTGTPTTFFDGIVKKGVTGTGPSDYQQNTYNSYKATIDSRYTTPSPVTISVHGSLTSTTAEVTVVVNKVDTIVPSNLYVRAVIFENDMTYSTETYQYVVRGYAEKPITIGDTQVSTPLSIPLGGTWNTAKLGLAAFVQSGTFTQSGVSNKEVLNSAVCVNWIPNTPPTLTLSQPANGAVLNGTTPITWAAHDGEELDANLSVDLFYKNATKGWTALALNETNDGTYSWDTVAYTDGDYYLRINVTDSWGGGNQIDTGKISIDNPDAPKVTLTYPVPDITVHGSVNITWIASDKDPVDVPSALKVSLFYTVDGTTWTPIVENVVNTGYYQWNTSALADSTNYMIRVAIKDSFDLIASDQMHTSFTIHNYKAPLITLDTSIEGKTISGEYTVKWTVTGGEGALSAMDFWLYLSSDGGITWTPVFEEKNYPTAYKMDTTMQTNGQYLMKVRVKDTVGLEGSDVTNAPFTIYNNDPPTLTLTAPVTSESYDRLLNITYSASDKQDALKDLNISIYYSEDASDWTTIIENSAAMGFYAWDISSVKNGEYYVKVVIIDRVGATAEAQSDAFTIDNNLPPTISAFSPTGGETLKGEFAITWKATDPNKDELKITIQVQTCEGTLCGLFEDLATDLANTGSYTVKAGTLKPAEYNFKIIAREVRAEPLQAFVITSDYVNIVSDTIPADDDVADDDTTVPDDDTVDDDTNVTDDDTNGTNNNGGKGSDSSLMILIILIIVVLVIGAVVIALVLVMKSKGKKSAPPPAPAQQAPVPQPAHQQPQPAQPTQYKPYNPPPQAQPQQQMAAPNQPNSLPPGGGAPQNQLALPPTQSAPGQQGPVQ